MVFFTCNACGESIKRAQVEKHYMQQCRSCNVLSCVDCGKDFRGDEYKQHTKCISEEEKYSGKDYKPKPGAGKGEKKQDAWIENVQQAINKANAHPKVKAILLQIQDYPNIPRKKQKFENFLKNSLRVRDTSLIAQAWDRINSEIAKDNETKENSATSKAAEVNTASNNQENNAPNGEEVVENGTGDKKLSKRERKEERRKQTNKKEKKDKSGNEEGESKRVKKRKRGEVEENEESEVSSKKKKKKKHEDEEEEGQGVEEEDEEEEEDAVAPRPKFEWDSAILEVLQAAKGNEISMKKLRKKVFAEYMATGGDGKCRTEEKIISKFHKKVMKKTWWKIEKDNVRLLQQ